MEIIQLDNRRIVKKIKKGELDCLLSWMMARKDKLYKIGWSYLYNHEDIEDIFQNTLLKASENINSLKKPDYFETWFISIFINECRKLLRERKREIINGEIKLEGYYTDEYNFFQEINSIDEIYIEVIVLKYISGYSQEEISEILNIPLGTVKSRIYRGLKNLRERIGEV